MPPQYPGDSDPNNADCGNDWCWQNRWYVAHGYEWSDRKQDWIKSSHNPIFYDEAIIKQVLGELGIGLVADVGLSWSLPEETKVATGIVKFGMALSGGLAQLKNILRGPANIYLEPISPCLGEPCAPPPWLDPLGFGHSVYMGKDWLDNTDAFEVASQTVHELAHVIDWQGSFSDRWKVYPGLTDYARHGGLFGTEDKWAEAVTVFVHGNAYKPDERGIDALQVQEQMDRMKALLNGWY